MRWESSSLDDLVRAVNSSEAGVKAVKVASGKDADWRAVDAVAGPDGTTFAALGPGGVKLEARVRLPGAFNVANALGPWLAGLALTAGLGLPATGWVGVALALGGLAIWAVSCLADRRGGEAPAAR